MTDCDLDTSVPDWLTDHPETLAIFQQLEIDYHCGGKSLRYACHEKGLNPDEVLKQLLNSISSSGAIS